MLFIALSIVQAISVSDVEFTPDYSPENVKAVGDGVAFTMDTAGKGSRIKGPESMHGRICAVPQTPMLPGTVLAMYASSGEPAVGVDRATAQWDELDFEFLRENGVADNGKVYLNTFHDGKSLEGKFTSTGLRAIRGSSSKFCISWSIGPNPTTGVTANRAVWTMDGRVMNTHDLTGWTKPMIPYVSYWSSAGSTDPGLLSWAGRFSPAVSTAVLSSLEYVTLNAPTPTPSPNAPKNGTLPESSPSPQTSGTLPNTLSSAASMPTLFTSVAFAIAMYVL